VSGWEEWQGKIRFHSWLRHPCLGYQGNNSHQKGMANSWGLSQLQSSRFNPFICQSLG